ncbi:hypothetical protein AAVH_31698 [Aphelenchoides avenae]|nr:hypothetical protein AAVH_31698 [Aphelenchus avenae]
MSLGQRRSRVKLLLDLATGAEKILDIDDGTWIGLQLSGRGYGGIYYNITDGSTGPSRRQTEGWWEDGTPYDDTDVVLNRFWTRMDVGWDQPNEEPLPHPNLPYPYFKIGECSDYPEKIPQTGYNYERCQEDKFQHCTQPYGYKWNDRWCFFLQRGYICQRDADSVKDPYHLNDEL